MPVLKNILKPKEYIDVPFGAECVRVGYFPQYMTPEFEETLKGLQDEKTATPSFLDTFCSLISEWDLKADDADEFPIPLKPEALRTIPFDVLGDILGAVMEASLPKPETEATSGDGSQPEDTLEQDLTGTP